MTDTSEVEIPTVMLMSQSATSMQATIYRALGQLGVGLSPEHWCLIGGLMVEVVLASRGVAMTRPTNDGDVIGDVVGNRYALRSLGRALEELGFHHHPSGWKGDPTVRFRNPSGAVIDVLRPANTSKQRNVVGIVGRETTLEAPGTDFALTTATLLNVIYSPSDPPTTMRVPSLLGAMYAKASAAKTLQPKDRPLKHLHDAAQLLAAARQDELEDQSKAVAKRLIWLQQHLADTEASGWDYVALDRRNDAVRRLNAACQTYR